MSSKKKAFTLTELLVVVIVIGVLSAVVLPKFNKVIETRRTTEAEEILSAIRTEQERRCTLGQKYTSNMDNLQEIVPHAQTRNYEYRLTNMGAIAKRNEGGYEYELKVPHYADGRVCCEGDACSKLNKDYPACGATFQIASADLDVDRACQAPITCSGARTRSCGCNNRGTQTATSCDTTTGTWIWGNCSVGECQSCSGTAPQQTTSCTWNGNPCGEKTRTAVCDPLSGEWTYTGTEWSECTAGSCECTNGDKQWTGETCDCNGQGQKYRLCQSGRWSSNTFCDKRGCTCTGSNTQACGCDGTQTRTCDTTTGQWSAWGECTNQQTSKTVGTCGCKSDGQYQYTCVNSSWRNDGCSTANTNCCTQDDPNWGSWQNAPTGYTGNSCYRTKRKCNQTTMQYEAEPTKQNYCCQGTAEAKKREWGLPNTTTTWIEGTKRCHWNDVECRWPDGQHQQAPMEWQMKKYCVTESTGGCGPSPEGDRCCVSGTQGCCPDYGGGDVDIDPMVPDQPQFGMGNKTFSFYYTAQNCPSGYKPCDICNQWGTKRNCSCTTAGWACQCR